MANYYYMITIKGAKKPHQLMSYSISELNSRASQAKPNQFRICFKNSLTLSTRLEDYDTHFKMIKIQSLINYDMLSS